MSDEQETIPEANAPKPIRIDKRSCSLPVKPWPWNGIPQHHMCHEPVMEPHASKVASPPQCESTRSHIATLRRHHSQRPYAQIVRLYHRRCDHP